MENPNELEGMSLNYKINGDVCSFKSKAELAKHLNFVVTSLREPLEVEPLDRQGLDYDHMQKITDLTCETSACVKGIDAIAECIQRHGTFTNFSPSDIVWLGIMCRQLLGEIIDISEASESVYEEQWKAKRENWEARHRALQAQPGQC